MAGRPRVLIADDYAPTRAGVRRVLEQAGFVVCAEVADAGAAVRAAGQARPDLCLLGLELTGEPVEAVMKIHLLVPTCPVVMLTGSSDDRHLFAAVRAGALGYLPRDMDPERLPAALQSVLRGEAAIPRALTARLLEDYRRLSFHERMAIPGKPDVKLTRREGEIFQQLRRGKTTAEIADSLSISQVTVRRHVSELLRKLGVGSREAAVRLPDSALEGG